VVLKIPDGSFSRGVVKAESRAELEAHAAELFRDSELILAQEFLDTSYDWRIGVLDREPLFACRYFMYEKHWQIYDHGKGADGAGDSETLAVEDAPRPVVRAALRAANLIGDGLYGVDVKQSGRRVVVIEGNDNPSIDAGFEDAVLGPTLYERVMRSFLRRLDAQRA
jgi:glutathione synthase/RimK-type ligase-like ATP-grasp enzyme